MLCIKEINIATKDVVFEPKAPEKLTALTHSETSAGEDKRESDLVSSSAEENDKVYRGNGISGRDSLGCSNGRRNNSFAGGKLDAGYSQVTSTSQVCFGIYGVKCNADSDSDIVSHTSSTENIYSQRAKIDSHESVCLFAQF